MFNLFTKTKVATPNQATVPEQSWADVPVSEAIEAFDPMGWEGLIVNEVFTEHQKTATMELASLTSIWDDHGNRSALITNAITDELIIHLSKSGIGTFKRDSVVSYMEQKGRPLNIITALTGSSLSWRVARLERYNAVVPGPITNRILEVLRACNAMPQETYSTTEDYLCNPTEISKGIPIIEITSLERGVVPADDPFVSVRILKPIKDVDFLSHPVYFGVWNEPDFKGRYYLPNEPDPIQTN